MSCDSVYKNRLFNVDLIVNGNANLSAFNGTTLDKDVIEVECEVTQAPASGANTYLTNIA